MLKGFALKQILKAQMRNVPKDQQEQLKKFIDEKPELIEQIANEIQEEMKQEKDQMKAMMTVVERHKEELAPFFGKQ